VPGSLEREADGLSVRFLIADAAAAAPLTVTYRGGQVPDTMSDTSANNIEIVAEGKLNTQGTFTATDVLAKCPSRLDDAAPSERDYTATSN
jgi:cytochrome c-type biogenesis protein CcmE